MAEHLSGRSRRPGPGSGAGGQVRPAALRALNQVLGRGAWANLAVRHVLERTPLGPQERHQVTELVYGTLRRLKTLDWVLSRLARQPLEKLPLPFLNVLRLGLFQLMYLPQVPAAVACDSAVSLARLAGYPRLAGLANALLRGYLRRRESLDWPDPGDAVSYLAVRHSHPEWLVKRWLSRYPREQVEALLALDNKPAPVILRVNLLRASRDALQAHLQAQGWECRAVPALPEALRCSHGGPQPLDQLDAFRQGQFTPQDLGAMAVSRVLDPQPGETVLDLTAAPGGKSTHIAELQADTGQVVALDVYPHRLELIRQNARRLGLQSIQTRLLDGRRAPDLLAEAGTPWAEAGGFARVLLDAPCSGLGVLRRHPDARWRKVEEQLPQLAQGQRELLAAAARCVRPGGTLVYSTCSNEPEETTEIVEAFLANEPDFLPAPPVDVLDGFFRPFLRGPWLELLPANLETDGFFIARLRRRV
ncbi:MAG: 16S rRNA (cytosine(967)-C(5))-methyltransferase RsmB [Firmicutes bacterium]|nr:16S rRNA (cytosine(967)-C(5))-methyltransferase RsmB [Bacillota bacterium]